MQIALHSIKEILYKSIYSPLKTVSPASGSNLRQNSSRPPVIEDLLNTDKQTERKWFGKLYKCTVFCLSFSCTHIILVFIKTACIMTINLSKPPSIQPSLSTSKPTYPEPALSASILHLIKPRLPLSKRPSPILPLFSPIHH